MGKRREGRFGASTPGSFSTNAMYPFGTFLQTTVNLYRKSSQFYWDSKQLGLYPSEVGLHNGITIFLAEAY